MKNQKQTPKHSGEKSKNIATYSKKSGDKSKNINATKIVNCAIANGSKLIDNIKNSFNTIKKQLSEKLSNSKLTNNILTEKIKTITFPLWMTKYKSQITSGALLTFSSILLLSGVTLFNSIFNDGNISSFYSAKSYTIFLNNQKVGVVRDEKTVDETVAKIQNEIENNLNTNINITSNIQVVESTANDNEITSEVSLYSKIKSRINYKSVAYEINVNGKRIGVVESEEVANKLIQEVKNYFTKNYNQEDIIEVSLEENVTINEVNVDLDEIQSEEELLDYIITGTNEKTIYTVEAGDTYWDIAIKYDLTVDELLSANPDASDNLMPGDELSLTVPKPFINVNIKRTLVAEEKIKYESTTQYVSYMYSDQSTVKKAGVYGVAEVTYEVTEQNGIQVEKEEVSRTVISNPETEIILVGTQTPPPKTGTGVFINPLPGATISSRYGSRSGGFHYGLDMAKATGSSIKAADGGTVIYSGYYGSYGYLIEIDHGGGFTTRYAHCSELLVSKGEKVYQGQVIAKVGSTGYSTGPHLHFEVRKYGTTLNPSNWIGQQYK